MAVQLTIDISDSELAKITEWLDALKPGLSPAEKKTMMEKHAKTLLKDDLLVRIRNYRVAQAREAENLARQAEGDEIVVEDQFAVEDEV